MVPSQISVGSPFAPAEPPRRFSGLALTAGLHALVAIALLIGFETLEEPPLAPSLLMVDLAPVKPATPPSPPQQPAFIKPVAPVQSVVPPVIDQQDPSPPIVAAPASPAPSPAVTAGAEPAADRRLALETWEGHVRAELQRAKRYPFAAMQAGQQDVVTVHVVLDGAGNVLEATIVTSKSYPLLDQAALELLRRVGPLPPPPASALTGNRIAFDLPIDYRIKPAR